MNGYDALVLRSHWKALQNNTQFLILLNAYLIRAASFGCLQAVPGMPAKHMLKTYHRGSICLLPWSSIRRRGPMHMWCLENIGRESWEWVVTTFGRLSRLMLPPWKGDETLTDVCLLTG